ncbi:MAG: OmpA family protein [Crocinitomicaceae bacterium]|nr:OmpA family protein [Crocinitomicaceae bacterium]
MKVVVVAFLTFASILSFAQDKAGAGLKKAKKAYEALNFPEAIRLYQGVLRIDENNSEALDAMADIYLLRYQLYDSAQIYLERRIGGFLDDTNYVVYYKYANCLRYQEKPEDALKYYNLFLDHGFKKKGKGTELEKEIQQSIYYCNNALAYAQTEEPEYRVQNMDFFVNSVDAEYTPIFIEKDNLLLYNARYQDHAREMTYADNQFFENIYYYDIEESVASSYDEGLDQANHHAVVSRGYNSDTIVIFYQNKVWVSKLEENRIGELQALPEHLSSNYFQPHGVFSTDQKTFVYSAQQEYDGNLDIYISRYENGTWSLPVSISPKINTPMNEDSPFLSNDGKTLYFSSKGHNSLGGYDIFKSEFVDGEWTKPVNLGKPINSAGDDIYLRWNADEKTGYFSSNRDGGFGLMDIYYVELNKKTVEGKARDKDGNLLVGVEVQFKDKETGEITTTKSNDDGEFYFLAERNREYELLGTLKDYFDGTSEVSTATEETSVYTELELEKDPGLSLYMLILDHASSEPLDSVKITLTDNMTGISEVIATDENGEYLKSLPDKHLKDRGSYNLKLEKEGYLTKTVTYNCAFYEEGKYAIHKEMDISLDKVEVGNDLSKIIDIKPIYFDLGKSTIRPDAALELDKIVKIMNENPNMVIELGSHTDARGSASSNAKLSDRRAKTSAKYIKERITNPDRISGKGYGETKLVNECADGVSCSEEEHQMNRRTEFIIIKM